MSSNVPEDKLLLHTPLDTYSKHERIKPSNISPECEIQAIGMFAFDQESTRNDLDAATADKIRVVNNGRFVQKREYDIDTSNMAHELLQMQQGLAAQHWDVERGNELDRHAVLLIRWCTAVYNLVTKGKACEVPVFAVYGNKPVEGCIDLIERENTRFKPRDTTGEAAPFPESSEGYKARTHDIMIVDYKIRTVKYAPMNRDAHMAQVVMYVDMVQGMLNARLPVAEASEHDADTLRVGTTLIRPSAAEFTFERFFELSGLDIRQAFSSTLQSALRRLKAGLVWVPEDYRLDCLADLIYLAKLNATALGLGSVGKNATRAQVEAHELGTVLFVAELRYFYAPPQIREHPTRALHEFQRNPFRCNNTHVIRRVMPLIRIKHALLEGILSPQGVQPSRGKLCHGCPFSKECGWKKAMDEYRDPRTVQIEYPTIEMRVGGSDSLTRDAQELAEADE